MHLTYDIDERKLFSGTREKIISNALSTFKVEDRFGELILEVKDARFGDALYAFAQALVKMGDVLCLSKEHVQSTFMADFQALFHEVVPETDRDFDWHDPEHDEAKKYTVDCRINGMPEPFFVYALANNDRIRDATIKLQKITQWNIPFRPLGIFQDRGAANRQVVARFDDVCPVQFSNFKLNRQEIIDYLGENIQRTFVQ